jgi:hypothetical protein
MNNGGMDAGDRVAEKDNKNLLGIHIEKRSQGNLGLIGESFGLVEDNDLWPGGDKERFERGANKGIDSPSDCVEASLVAGV